MNGTQSTEGLDRHGLPRTKLVQFVLPDDAPTLRLAFDNLRNFVVIGALLGGGGYLLLHPESTRAATFILGTGLALLGLGALLLNVFQTVLLVFRTLAHFLEFDPITKFSKLTQRRLPESLLWLISIALTATVFGLVCLLLMFSITLAVVTLPKTGA